MMKMSHLLLAAVLALSPTLATAEEGCVSIETQLIVPPDVKAVTSVSDRPETCSLLIGVTDTTHQGQPVTFEISASVQAVHGEVSVKDGLLRYRRTKPMAEQETLLLQLKHPDHPTRSATLIIFMRSRVAKS